MKCLRFLTVATLLALAWRPALAADATFPPGLRVGLAPLVGLSRAKTFSGFQSEDESVKVLMTELPAEAYGEVSSAFTARAYFVLSSASKIVGTTSARSAMARGKPERSRRCPATVGGESRHEPECPPPSRVSRHTFA